MEEFSAEVRNRWGRSEAYKEYREKTKKYAKEDYCKLTEGFDELFLKFAACMAEGHKEDSSEARALVGLLQDYISKNLYTCTDDILAGLGQMYISDGRFTENIDKAGNGTADYVSKAIDAFVKMKY